MKIYNKKNLKISLRYCKNCECIRKFKYSHFIFHSECTKCFCRDARQLTEEEFNESKYNKNAWLLEK